MNLAHFVKISFRQIKRNTSSFVINVLGLSTGLACALLIFIWVIDESQTDKFHELDHRLFQIMEHQNYSENIGTTISTPGILAEELKKAYPDVEFATGMDWGSDNVLTVGEQNIKQAGRHVSADFLSMFTFPLVQGSPETALIDPKSIVISEKVATALFGSSTLAMGQTIKFDHDEDLKVTGVLKNVSPRSTMQFDFLCSWERWLNNNTWGREWGNNGPHTYVVLREGTSAEDFSEKIAGFIKERNDDSNVTLFARQFSSRYLRSRYENGELIGGRIEYVRLFSIIALFILAIASINFMNLSTARATNRAKEVGVKKTIGATRGSLISQYLTESVLIALFSLILALGLAYIALPQFNTITDKSMSLIPNWQILVGFIVLTLATGLFAGSYPALYLSSFKPVTVLKGTLRSSIGEVWARKGLVVFQFTISAFLITAVLVIYKQIQFVQDRNLGYDKDQIVMFEMSGALEEDASPYLQSIEGLPGIRNASSIGHSLVGRNNNTSGLHWPGKDPDTRILFENMRVNYDALETMGVNLKEGRSFSREYGLDSNAMVLNETAVKVMELDEPLGTRIKLWDTYNFNIVGVVEDFHFQSLHEPVKPLFFILRPQTTWFLMAALERGQEQEGIQNLKKEWEKINPGFPFDYWFVDEEFAQLYTAETRVAVLSRFFAFVAIVISCLGLFGLASFTAERKRKEIGIRKVLGATSGNIVNLINREFSLLVGIALVIGLPLSYFIMANWLERFEFKIDLQVWFFAVAGLLVLVIAYSTVTTQAYKAAITNPKDSLRDE